MRTEDMILGKADAVLCNSSPVVRPKILTSSNPTLRNARVKEVRGRPLRWALGDSKGQPQKYRILVASDRNTRERAYALAADIYRLHGFVAQDRGWCTTPYDAQPDTFTLLAEDAQGQAAATVTLVFDAEMGLPCDAVFEQEVMRSRLKGRRLAEVTRLAVHPNHAGAKSLLTHLFNFIYIYARKVRAQDAFVIEVNPRHALFYKRMFGFEAYGPMRKCPRVENAPAALLCLDLHKAERSIEKSRVPNALKGHERSLYSKFLSANKAHRLAMFLKCGHRPMSAREMEYFGIRVPKTIGIQVQA